MKHKYKKCYPDEEGWWWYLLDGSEKWEVGEIVHKDGELWLVTYRSLITIDEIEARWRGPIKEPHEDCWRDI